MDVATKQLLSDKLDWIKFSGLSWKGDGFYYSRYDAPDEKSKLSKKNEFHKVYFHKVGTPQDQDQLIYVDKEHPLRNAGVGLTEDERFLILSTTEGTSGLRRQGMVAGEVTAEAMFSAAGDSTPRSACANLDTNILLPASQREVATGGEKRRAYN